MRIPIEFDNKGKLILGIFHVANYQLNVPLVLIMCYGLNGHRVVQHRMAVKFGERLEENGVNLVRFDYRNVGVSEGNFEKSNIQERVEDIISVCKYVKACFYNKKIRIVLVGFSDGARNVLKVTEKVSIDGIVLWNPILNILDEKKSVINLNSKKLSLHPLYKVPIKKLLGVGMSLEMIRQIEAENVINVFEKYDKDILLIFGDNDELSKDVREYLIYKDLINRSNMKYVTINNADHLFNKSEYVEQVFKVTIDWLLRNLYCQEESNYKNYM